MRIHLQRNKTIDLTYNMNERKKERLKCEIINIKMLYNYEDYAV